MSETTILMGLIPLILFVIVDSFAGLKAGLVVAVIAALAEAVYTLITFGEIDMITGTSLFLVTLMSAISYKMKSPLLFKLQPVVIGFFFIAILYYSIFTGKPLFTEMMSKYSHLLPIEQQELLKNPKFMGILDKFTLNFAHILIPHTLLVAYAAFKLKNWWWLILRGLGFYLAMFIALILSR